jgi:hypothetical protein
MRYSSEKSACTSQDLTRGRMDDHDFITIVSGLPRSGTSMMMKMLESGNMEILSDNERKPDIDNPRGYYELEKVKTLAEDNQWLGSARGKVIKVVSPLLPHLFLEQSLRYKIIFMLRSLDEILASQEKMAERLHHRTGTVQSSILKQNFSVHLEEIRNWMEQHNSIEFTYINYSDVISYSAAVADDVCRFLGLSLDREKMTTVADRELYRHRSGNTGEKQHDHGIQSEHQVIMDQLKQLGYL